MQGAELQVMCVDMKTSKYNIWKENCILRHIVSLPLFQVLIVWLLIGLAYAKYKNSSHIAAMILVTSGLIFRQQFRKLKHACVRKSIDVSVDLQAKALREFKPDIVVGSSWGGGIASILVAKQIWRGPTVLLAPAFKKMCQESGNVRYNWDECKTKVRAAGEQISVFHGGRDKTVSIKDSEELCAGSKLRLTVFPKGDHSNHKALVKTGRLLEIVREELHVSVD